MDLLDIAIVKRLTGGGGGSGTDNYNDLSNLPKINDTTLSGNKTSANLGLQSEINSDSKLASDLVDDTNQDNKFVTSSEKSTWNGKQNAIDADHKINADYVDDSTSTNKFVTATDKETWNAKQNAIDSSHKLSSDLVDDTNHTNKFVTSTEKQTWNGKQNAIDSDHKLSSSLVSFTTAEAAALASGIDSTKVGQISTNQTNILYSLEHGAKNLFRWNKWVNDCTVVGGTKSIDAYGKLILTSSSTDCYTEYSGSAYPDVEIAVKENEQYVLMWEYSRLAGGSRGIVYVVFEGSTGTTSASASAELKKLEFTTPSGTTGLRIYINQTANGMQEQYYDFMVCSKVIWDTLGHDYQPPSVSNYDLTVREAEDRAALVECVDEGAKNKFDISTATFDNQDGQFSVTYNGDSATIKRISGSATLTTPNFSVRLNPGTYVLSGCPSSGSDSTYRLDLRDPFGPVVDGSIDYGSGSSAFKISETKTYKIALRFANNYTVPAEGITITPMICTEADWKISQNYAPYALPNTDLTRMVSELQKKSVKVYTYHVNPNESDPEDAVTYLDDATGLTPAKMGASSFSYGSWANAWFLPRPCMLKSDGTVAYYLNPNDYSKKTDGTASDIADLTFDGNVMLEFPKIWVKRVNDGNGARTVSIAPVNVDGTYKCWSNINAEDKEVDHFYLPAYNGTIDNNAKMRSMSDVTLSETAPQTSPYAYAPNYTRAQEVTAATANNPTGKNLWYTETWADFCLIYDLLYLMGKSLDVQRTFGQGLSSGSETAVRAYVTGTHNSKGLFYGDISGTSTAVKVLGMENLWGCRWHGVAGLINDNGTLKVKMTYGVADGSTTVGYNTTGSGYLTYGSTYGTNGFVKKMQADNTMGYKIIETAGTDATYYCDYYYTNTSQSNYALLGGHSGNGAYCGFCVNLHYGAATANWTIGGSLSCKP